MLGMNLKKIYENYSYISGNLLCLHSFIEDYKKENNTKIEEKEDTIIMETKIGDSSNKYNTCKKLYIDKKTLKPIKMEIEDINKKVLVYILYNEIKINSTDKEEVLAFKLKIEKENI